MVPEWSLNYRYLMYGVFDRPVVCHTITNIAYLIVRAVHSAEK